jgi:hypothetical protein
MKLRPYLSRCGSICLPLILVALAVTELRAQSFVSTGRMTIPRVGHTATLLQDGRVLIAGGAVPSAQSRSQEVSSAEVYDPVSGTFAETGAMTSARSWHSAVLLRDGRVFLVGGCASCAELYNPSTGTFARTGDMSVAQRVYSAVLLMSGKVLVTGAITAELFDPATGTFVSLNSGGGIGETASLLPDGTVLLASSSSVLLFDPANDGFIKLPIGWPFWQATATPLLDGSVLFAGGNSDGYGEVAIRHSALYDFASQTLKPKAEMAMPRNFHTATQLKDGRVLIAGGYNGEGPDEITGILGNAELYDPATGRFSALISMTRHRDVHTATLLQDGRVLITGGRTSATRWPLDFNDSTAELFIPGSTQGIPPIISASYNAPIISGDYNGDCTSDIIWRDTSGNVFLRPVSGSTIASDRFIANIWTGWMIVGTGDFNGDGKADILWRTAAGDVAIWLMDGVSITKSSIIANIWTGWTIVGTGDFNGDGKADILWRDTAGDVAMWLMDGLSITTGSTITNIWTGWTIVGTGDFNGDGKADILWRDTAGNVAMWLMDGLGITAGSTIANIWTGWTIVGTGDFNADGKADILWRDTSGSMSIWLMDGTAILSHFNG